MKKEIALNSVQ